MVTHRRRGRTLALADCLIAAAAVGIDATLATGNPKDVPDEGAHRGALAGRRVSVRRRRGTR